VKITENSCYANSPFTDDDKQKFVINLKEGFWKCFKTNKAGRDFFSLIEEMKKEGISVQYEFTFLQENKLEKKIEKRNIAKKILENSQFEDIFFAKNSDVIFLNEYLKKRHLTFNKIKRYKLKYIYNKEKSFLFIPFFDLNENFIGFQLHNYMKYPEYEKYQTFFLEDYSKIFVYGFNNIIKNKINILYICEGIFDAIQSGGIAKLGANLTPSQISFLQESGYMNCFERVILLQDNDEVGRKSLKKDYEKLINAFPFLSGKIYFYCWDNNYKDINEQGFIDEKKIKLFDTINYLIFLKH